MDGREATGPSGYLVAYHAISVFLDVMGCKIVYMYYSEHDAGVEVTDPEVAPLKHKVPPGVPDAAEVPASDPTEVPQRAPGEATTPTVPPDTAREVPPAGAASAEVEHGNASTRHRAGSALRHHDTRQCGGDRRYWRGSAVKSTAKLPALYNPILTCPHWTSTEWTGRQVGNKE